VRAAERHPALKRDEAVPRRHFRGESRRCRHRDRRNWPGGGHGQASATTTAAIACHIGYSVTGQWPNGFEAAITIKNTGTNPINGWKLTWTWAAGQKITQAWSASYSQTGANVTLTNESYNATIAPGATLTGIGFNGSYTGTNPAPSAFYVNGTLCK